MNKKWLVLGSVVLLIIGVTIFTNKILEPEQIKTEELINKKVLAIKIEQEDGSYTDSTTIPTTGYVFNQEKSKCNNGATPSYDNNTKRFYADNLTQNGTSCYLTFDIAPTAEDTIAKLNVQNIKTGTPDFTVVATGIETEDNNGVYVTDDPMYGTNAKTYYWRGAATTNHMIFDNKCWRIVRINGDGSIRLIYNGTPTGNTCPGNGANSSSIVLSGTAYNPTSNNSKYVGWTYSTSDMQRPTNENPQTSGTPAPLKTALESWYSTNILDNSKVVKGNFCNDRNTQNNEQWRATGATQYYAAYQRLSSGTKTPTLLCSDGDVYSLDVGMITADEVQFAGASGNSYGNGNYYLYNKQYYWTLTPGYWWNNNQTYAYMFIVHNDGIVSATTAVYSVTPGVRPVINLRSDVTFNLGSDGTQNNPYIVQ